MGKPKLKIDVAVAKKTKMGVCGVIKSSHGKRRMDGIIR
jgi:hypothetical protein